MKNRKFYVVIFCVMVLSLSILSLSYSKESGKTQDITYNENEYENFRIVYSDTTFESGKNISFTITNNSDENRDYSLRVNLDGALGDVYYSLDGMDDQLLVDNEIFNGELNAFGDAGDLASHSIKLYSKSGVQFKYSISIDGLKINTLESNIKKSENVYLSNDIYRYYGVLVDNYIKYEGSLYRIVSSSLGDVKIVGDVSSVTSFRNENEFLSIDDYLGSFGESKKIEDVVSDSSWLNNGYSYWLNGDAVSDRYVVLNVGGLKTSDFGVNYYYRNCKIISGDLIVVNGNGSLDNPYEVTYGS
ncbi:MAG: hypothetical protein IJ475_02515 [Bacilli bacterium]|nr:hypothetical protein [Bacilli bacterium]